MAPKRRWMDFLELDVDTSSGNSPGSALFVDSLNALDVPTDVALLDATLGTVDLIDDPDEPSYL